MTNKTQLEIRMDYLTDSVGKLTKAVSVLEATIRAQIKVAQALNHNLVLTAQIIQERNERNAAE